MVQLGADNDRDTAAVGQAHSHLFRFDYREFVGRVAVLVARQFDGLGLIA